ncbi:hypothetical protein ACFW34_20875 [Streptomyces sp. NPDC058848]|uniref:hypothetical protein n=1 Tax=unclassified Streptomyces TaxID=2593676 RepID=UPI0036D022D3
MSADQLSQSRETTEQGAQSQAARVSSWVDSGDSKSYEIHIMNRSPDPVTGVVVGVWLGEAPEVDVPGDDDIKGGAMYLLPLSNLRPCSMISVSAMNLRYRLDGDDIGQTFDFLDSVKWKAETVATVFTDTNGVEWVRTPRVLVRSDSEDGVRQTSLLDRGVSRILFLDQDPRSTAVEKC